MDQAVYETLLDETRGTLRELELTLPERDPDYRDFGELTRDQVAEMVAIRDAALALLAAAQKAFPDE